MLILTLLCVNVRQIYRSFYAEIGKYKMLRCPFNNYREQKIMVKLVFDTLKYVKILENAGVAHSDIHAESLSEALSHNVYIKNEVDKMIEDVIRESNKQFAEQMHKLDKATLEMKAEIHRMFNRYTITTISILSALMALFAFIIHLIR
jgi:uncharacterized protein YdcH (DUF465 family)